MVSSTSIISIPFTSEDVWSVLRRFLLVFRHIEKQYRPLGIS